MEFVGATVLGLLCESLHFTLSGQFKNQPFTDEESELEVKAIK